MKKILVILSFIMIFLSYNGFMYATIESESDDYSYGHNYVKLQSEPSNYKMLDNYNHLFSSSYTPNEMSLLTREDMVTLATTLHYVYTPKGTQIEVYKRSPDFTQYEKDYYNQLCDSWFPNATRLGTATINYNCHSYAWYQQSTSNPYWMNDPTSYYTDGSYVESTGNVGEIIVYYDSTGFNLHSGIITAKTSGNSNGVLGIANLLTVVSKWGSFGLYEHRGDQCPYAVPYGGTASYVKLDRLQ